jgi:hypothetical protein
MEYMRQLRMLLLSWAAPVVRGVGSGESSKRCERHNEEQIGAERAEQGAQEGRWWSAGADRRHAGMGMRADGCVGTGVCGGQLTAAALLLLLPLLLLSSAAGSSMVKCWY